MAPNFGGAFDCILESLAGFAGRELDVDEFAVFFPSGRLATATVQLRGFCATTRLSAAMSMKFDEILDAYFRQCSVLVTARDLAINGCHAALANRGINPITGVQQVVTPNAVARTLSVMTTSGMYDYAGEWSYRVGIPAKSGVGRWHNRGATLTIRTRHLLAPPGIVMATACAVSE